MSVVSQRSHGAVVGDADAYTHGHTHLRLGIDCITGTPCAEITAVMGGDSHCAARSELTPTGHSSLNVVIQHIHAHSRSDCNLATPLCALVGLRVLVVGERLAACRTIGLRLVVVVGLRGLRAAGTGRGVRRVGACGAGRKAKCAARRKISVNHRLRHAVAGDNPCGRTNRRSA